MSALLATVRAIATVASGHLCMLESHVRVALAHITHGVMINLLHLALPA